MFKPEATIEVIAFTNTKREYEKLMSAINTSYGSVSSYLGSYQPEKHLATIASNAEFLAEQLTNIVKAQALGKTLAEMIEAGDDILAAEYEAACWKYAEYQRALENPVSLEKLAEAVLKHDAISSSDSALAKRRRENFWFWSIIDNYCLVNGTDRESATATALLYAEVNGMRYNMTADIIKVAA